MKKINGKLQRMTVRQLLDEWWKRLNDSSGNRGKAQEVNEEIKRRDEGELFRRVTMEQQENINKKAKRKYVEYFKGDLWKKDTSI